MNGAVIYLQSSRSFQTDSPSYSNPLEGEEEKEEEEAAAGAPWAAGAAAPLAQSYLEYSTLSIGWWFWQPLHL